jgi:hypothetical protein
MSISQATSLVQVLKPLYPSGAMSALFGGSFGAGSKAAVTIYAETANPGPVLQLGSGPVFHTELEEVIEAICSSFLLANEADDSQSTPVSSTRLLELSTEILTSWSTTTSSSSSADSEAHILLIIAPNAFDLSSAQWTRFITAVRTSRVLPIFYSPSPNPTWASEFSALWSVAFPSSSIPAHFGSQSIATTWQNFNLASAVSFARSLILSGAPFISETPKISFSSEQSLTSTRTIQLNVQLDLTATPFSAPTQSKVGVLGLRPVIIETRMAQAPSGTNAIASIQFLNATQLTLPISNDATAIKIISLPTEGTLYDNGVSISIVPHQASINGLSYQPHSTHGSEDEFTYKLIIPCGEWGPFTMGLNLTLTPLVPTANDISLSLTEDDISVKTIDFRPYISNTSPTATLTLLSLPTMAGSLKLNSDGSTASLTTRYPVSDSVFNFAIWRASRGSQTIELQYVVDNGLGATANAKVNIAISNIEHNPTIKMIRTSSYGNNFMLINDADNNTVSITVASSSGSKVLHVCRWVSNNSVCQDSASVTFNALQSPTIISAAYVEPLSLVIVNVPYTITVTDSTGRSTSGSGTASTGALSLLTDLLGGVLNLVGALLTGLTSILTLNPNTPSGGTTQLCHFPGRPSSASLIYDGSEATGSTWTWNPSVNTATYAAFEGVSGPDDVFFQCSYTKTNPFVGPISHWSFTLPITTPTASSLALSTAPDAPFTFIPIQGLISEGALSLQNVVAVGGTWTSIAGGIRFFATNTIGSISYQLCSVLNSTLCSGIISNTINLLDTLPLLGEPAQSFIARLNGSVNTFTLNVPQPANLDGFIILSIGPLSIGTLKINGQPIGAGNIGELFNDFDFTYEVSGNLPITANLLSLYSFTFAIVKDGKESQPGSVFILPEENDLLPLIPGVTESVTGLVDNLQNTLSVATTLIPGFRIEIDVFGKKESQPLYEQLLASIQEDNSRRKRSMEATPNELIITATLDVPQVGKFEICNSPSDCAVINPTLQTSVVVDFNQSVFFTPPLLSTLYDALGLLQWTLRLADTLLTFTERVLVGTLNLANDVLSDTLRINVLGNASPALRLNVPGVKKLLSGAGLDPDGCGEIPPSPLVCVGGQLIANDSVIVDSTTWTVSVENTRVINGDLTVTPTGTVIFEFLSASDTVPYLNISGEVLLEGHIQIHITLAQLNHIIFEQARRAETNDSRPHPAIEGSKINSTKATIGLLVESANSCYGVAMSPGQYGTRTQLSFTFNFNNQDEGCYNPATPPEDRNPNAKTETDKAKKKKNFIIWLSCAIAGGVLLLLLIGAAVLFKYNRSAKRLARPYSIRRIRGQAYRTQPSSEMTGSQGSTEVLPVDSYENNGGRLGQEQEIYDVEEVNEDDTIYDDDDDEGDIVDENEVDHDDLAETEDTEMPQSMNTPGGLGPTTAE